MLIDCGYMLKLAWRTNGVVSGLKSINGQVKVVAATRWPLKDRLS